MIKKEIRVFCDGGARGNPGPAAGAFVVEAEGKIVFKDSKFLGKATNNVAEYSALILAFSWLGEKFSLGASKILIILDSELVAKQMSGDFKVKNENLRKYFLAAKSLEKKITAEIKYHPVSRNENKLADFLVNKTLDENS